MPVTKSKNVTETSALDNVLVVPVKTKESNDDNPKTIGEVFQVIRLQKKLDINKVAETLNISPRFIKAIEAMDIGQLPEKVYTLGFVRSYSKFLNIDPQKSVNEFRTKFFNDKNIILEDPTLEINQSNLPSKKLIFGSTLILLLIVAGWFFYKSDKNMVRPSPEPEIGTPSQQTLIQEKPIEAQVPVNQQPVIMVDPKDIITNAPPPGDPVKAVQLTEHQGEPTEIESTNKPFESSNKPLESNISANQAPVIFSPKPRNQPVVPQMVNEPTVIQTENLSPINSELSKNNATGESSPNWPEPVVKPPTPEDNVINFQ